MQSRSPTHLVHELIGGFKTLTPDLVLSTLFSASCCLASWPGWSQPPITCTWLSIPHILDKCTFGLRTARDQHDLHMH